MKNIDYYNHSVESGYYDIVFKKNKGIQSAWHHIKFNYIKKKISNSKIHLDVGCGPGTFLGILKKKSIGVDISINQINYAKKNYSTKKIKFYSYKNKLPIKSKSVDSVTLIELIEHVDNEDLALIFKECKRVLKDNGCLYLSTPNYYSLWPALEIILNLISPVDYKHEHINKFNKNKLKKIMKKKQFSCFRIKFFYFSFSISCIFFFQVGKVNDCVR